MPRRSNCCVRRTRVPTSLLTTTLPTRCRNVVGPSEKSRNALRPKGTGLPPRRTTTVLRAKSSSRSFPGREEIPAEVKKAPGTAGMGTMSEIEAGTCLPAGPPTAISCPVPALIPSRPSREIPGLRWAMFLVRRYCGSPSGPLLHRRRGTSSKAFPTRQVVALRLESSPSLHLLP